MALDLHPVLAETVSRRVWFLLVLTFAITSGTAASSPADTAFTEANRLYEQERYPEAIQTYRALLEQGVNSSALHFNLGNAFLRSDQTGQAIFHYRRAQQLAPRDPDVRANLQFARQQTGLAQSPTTSFWRSVILRLTLNEWTILTMIALWSCLALLALTHLKPRLRQPLRPPILVLAATTLLFVIPLTAAWHEHRRSSAIVVVPHTIVRFGPFPESPEHYALPDGAELDVLDQFNDWLQVRDPEGRLGWLTTNEIALFRYE